MAEIPNGATLALVWPRETTIRRCSVRRLENQTISSNPFSHARPGAAFRSPSPSPAFGTRQSRVASTFWSSGHTAARVRFVRVQGCVECSRSHCHQVGRTRLTGLELRNSQDAAPDCATRTSASPGFRQPTAKPPAHWQLLDLG
jgi:hypothetical protein